MNNSIFSIKYASLLASIETLTARKKPIRIAIDGRCASGKTTLAEMLANTYGASVIHMDDFYLPPELRSDSRYEQPGGTIHYERFLTEVACGLKGIVAFYYNVFDCGTMAYKNRVLVDPSSAVIVEGSYCLRPEFRDLYDLKVFLNIDPSEQERRIKSRNGESAYKMFAGRWIPFEEKYFEALGVRQCCDFVFEG